MTIAAPGGQHENMKALKLYKNYIWPFHVGTALSEIKCCLLHPSTSLTNKHIPLHPLGGCNNLKKQFWPKKVIRMTFSRTQVPPRQPLLPWGGEQFYAL